MNTVLVGAQWGDEGKGKVIDFLTEESDVVVRFQGGSNAGHTVVVGDKKYVLHLVPSGILHNGKHCVIGNGVVMDPFDLMKELEQVESWGFELKGRFHISERAQMVMQWHRAIDKAEEAARPEGKKIGTTGRGIGPAYAAKVGCCGMRVTDAVLPELYPVKKEVADGTEVPSIIRDMKKITGAIRAAGSPVRSVWPIIQYFMGSSWLRYPTAEELRAMSWLGIIHGGNGITWYFYAGDAGTYKGANLTPEHWATFSAVTREVASYSGLSAKFGRSKFFSKDFFPYALYYLGLLTFESQFRLQIPNLTIRNMFVDYYDELSAFTNEDVARRHFIGACEELVVNGGTWANVFEQFWQHYVKARIPAQAFDKMNENFFRTTFASRCMDAMPMVYSVWSEFNVSAGRIDFLASPKPGTNLRACLIEFKYMNCAEADRTHLLGKDHPEPADVKQTMDYFESLVRDPNWTHGREVEVVIVEVAGNRGYNWHTLQA